MCDQFELHVLWWPAAILTPTSWNFLWLAHVTYGLATLRASPGFACVSVQAHRNKLSNTIASFGTVVFMAVVARAVARLCSRQCSRLLSLCDAQTEACSQLLPEQKPLRQIPITSTRLLTVCNTANYLFTRQHLASDYRQLVFYNYKRNKAHCLSQKWQTKQLTTIASLARVL